MIPLDDTHDPSRESWVESANDPTSDFPIQNLPFGVAGGTGGDARLVVAIGDQAVDLRGCRDSNLLDGLPEAMLAALGRPVLNDLMARPASEHIHLRRSLTSLLDAGSGRRRQVASHLLPMASCEMQLPALVGDYTDFYASIFHATNVGSMFRPDHPLLPNYKFVPVGYHGRASSIVRSGSVVHRPCGQTRAEGDAAPTFGPSSRLDFELEVGAWVGTGNPLGAPIPIDEAEERLFGLCLVNDWSARDIQQWEYQPLGPFLAKSFATSVSSWVVTMAALAPFRAPAFPRPAHDPAPLPYLSSAANRDAGGIDLSLQVAVSSTRMRREGCPPHPLSRASLSTMYWTFGQMVTHHASNGCNLRPGDLLASGTVSGPDEDARGCLLELAWRGTRPVTLPTGEKRAFLEDGDEVVMTGSCTREGSRRIGFGECRGIVQPAR